MPVCRVQAIGHKSVRVRSHFTQSNLSAVATKENDAGAAAESVAPLVDVLEGKLDGEAGMLLHNTGSYKW